MHPPIYLDSWVSSTYILTTHDFSDVVLSFNQDSFFMKLKDLKIHTVSRSTVIFFKKNLKHEGECVCCFGFQTEKGTLSPLECLSFANTIQADLPTCVEYKSVWCENIFYWKWYLYSDIIFPLSFWCSV